MPFYNFAIQHNFHNFTKFSHEPQGTHAKSHTKKSKATLAKNQKPKRH